MITTEVFGGRGAKTSLLFEECIYSFPEMSFRVFIGSSSKGWEKEEIRSDPSTNTKMKPRKQFMLNLFIYCGTK